MNRCLNIHSAPVTQHEVHTLVLLFIYSNILNKGVIIICSVFYELINDINHETLLNTLTGTS